GRPGGHVILLRPPRLRPVPRDGGRDSVLLAPARDRRGASVCRLRLAELPRGGGGRPGGLFRRCDRGFRMQPGVGPQAVLLVLRSSLPFESLSALAREAGMAGVLTETDDHEYLRAADAVAATVVGRGGE